MRHWFVKGLERLALTLLVITFITGCDAVDQLQEECEAGDENACEILETIGAALEELEDAVPEDLTLASVFEEAEGYLSSDKAERLAEVLASEVIERDGLAACLRALPPPPPVRDPVCYGPQMDYTNHPNSAGGTQSGQLPSGDLGIWLDTEPTQSGPGTAPCAAVKMNELISKAIHNIDMATGSIAMMVCAAAHERISAPRNPGDVLNFASVLNKVPGSPFTITTASLERVDANTLKSVLVVNHDGGTNNRLGNLSITTTHNQSTRAGLVQIEREDSGQNRTIATSARYRPNPTDADEMQVQVTQARIDGTQVSNFYDSEGDVKLGPISGNPRPIEDTHYFVAEFNPTDNTQKVAYGWNAGGNDSHYRVFNAEADATTADAWYGYVPNPFEAGGGSLGDTPDLDLSVTGAGMICNWAGPGNDHTVNSYLQHQTMTKDGQDRWILTGSGSLIRYVPTIACELNPNSGSATFSAVAAGGNPHAPSLAEHDIGEAPKDTYFDQSESNSEGLDLKSNHNVDLPDDSW
jgi:hypothetical protein